MNLTFTLGPASESDEIILGLLQTADRFRLNASHLDAAGLRSWLKRLQTLFEQSGKTIPVIIDLQGAKMRLGRLAPLAQLPERITLTLANESDAPSALPVPHEELFKAVRLGDILTLNDAKVRIEIRGIRLHEGRIDALVLTNGPVSSGKGVNRASHPIPYGKLLDRDAAMIAASKDFPFVEYAFSFVHSGHEAELLRPQVGRHRLIAKIERPEAIPNTAQIDVLFDEIWFCRGDLGAQAGLSQLGPLQDEFVSFFEKMRHPKILAGQVLEHMTHFPEPTRSEVVHLHDIRKAGFDGIVLSDETAIGKNPLVVADFLRKMKG